MTKSVIKSVIDKNDPMGLLAMGCPKDEYSPEIDRIFARIRKGMTTEEICAIIFNVFLEMFDEAVDQNLCGKMASELFSYNL